MKELIELYKKYKVSKTWWGEKDTTFIAFMEWVIENDKSKKD